jgi:hypothetical protein
MSTVKIPVIIEATIEVLLDDDQTTQDGFNLLREELFAQEGVTVGNRSFVFDAFVNRLGRQS